MVLCWKIIFLLGVAQGLRRLGTFSGLILGPIWGGATLHQPVLQMAIPLALLLLMAVRWESIWNTSSFIAFFSRFFFIGFVRFLFQENSETREIGIEHEEIKIWFSRFCLFDNKNIRFYKIYCRALWATLYGTVCRPSSSHPPFSIDLF